VSLRLLNVVFQKMKTADSKTIDKTMAKLRDDAKERGMDVLARSLNSQLIDRAKKQIDSCVQKLFGKSTDLPK
jgi:uncharacterized protein (DUF302 family)